ncbi:MAG: hypothetical protein U5R30_19870 [Deltaproteobacteria bacterium]|nr:hypothetical protein [Deltaproteobacteria bacterium]
MRPWAKKVARQIFSIPLKREYIERCLDQVPRQMAGDPGMNAFGTGATPPFLKRPMDDRGEFIP